MNDTYKYDLSALTGKSSGLQHPPGISVEGGGGKFTPEGAVLYFPGNTFICHIAPESAFYRSLCLVQDELKKQTQAEHLVFLPKSSFHMTVFCGVCGVPLGVDGWPDDMEPETSLDTINHEWSDRFTARKDLGGFKVVASHMRLPFSVAMRAATEADNTALWQSRSALQSLTSLHRPDFDSYQFHITLAYLTKWMNVSAAQQLVDASDRLFDDYLADTSPAELGVVEFCRFDSMCEFENILPAS